ncbi:MAG: hypothetical protein AAFU03_18840 [Bacteroidota bacterium]
MKYLIATILTVFFLSPCVSQGFEQYLYPPEMVIKLGPKIGLTADQERSIKTTFKETQHQFIDLKWELDRHGEDLKEELAKTRVDPEKSQALLQKLLTLENQIKMLQIGLHVKVKNLLTEEQQIKLDQLRKEMSH